MHYVIFIANKHLKTIFNKLTQNKSETETLKNFTPRPTQIFLQKVIMS